MGTLNEPNPLRIVERPRKVFTAKQARPHGIRHDETSLGAGPGGWRIVLSQLVNFEEPK